MADTQRLLSEIITLLADNTTGAISPQDLRDAVVTLQPGHGEISVTTPAATAIATVNIWYNIAGTFALSPDAHNWDMNTNGQLRYTGTANRCCHIAGSFSVSGAGVNDTYEIAIGKNGTPITPSIIRNKLSVSGDVQSSAAHAFTEVATNDYLTVMVRNITDADDPTFATANLFVMDMPCGD